MRLRLLGRPGAGKQRIVLQAGGGALLAAMLAIFLATRFGAAVEVPVAAALDPQPAVEVETAGPQLPRALQSRNAEITQRGTRIAGSEKPSGPGAVPPALGPDSTVLAPVAVIADLVSARETVHPAGYDRESHAAHAPPSLTA